MLETFFFGGGGILLFSKETLNWLEKTLNLFIWRNGYKKVTGIHFILKYITIEKGYFEL